MITTLSLSRSTPYVQALWVAGFAVLTAVGAQVQLPHLPVPYTMQTFVVLVAGAALGWRNGALSQFAYLALGACGLPVFAHIADGTAGITSLIGPTGGYLLAFPVAAGIVGFAAEKFSSRWMLLASMIVATISIFALGTLQLQLVLFHNWKESIAQGFMIFSWWDGGKILGAFGVGSLLRGKR